MYSRIGLRHWLGVTVALRDDHRVTTLHTLPLALWLLHFCNGEKQIDD